MIHALQQRLLVGFVVIALFAFPGATMVPAQQLDTASVVHQVDAAVKARIENLAGYTVTEHYAVYRDDDEIHPTAEMTVTTTYKKESGKSYVIVSQAGSSIVRNLVLHTILENEQRLNQPGTREGAWITSANYEMKLKPGGTQPLEGRDCLVLALLPKRKEPYLIEGTLWVDSKDGSIVQVQGTASKSSSLVTGPTQLMRQYANIDGYPQASHLRAVSKSFMFGKTIVKIDYADYRIQLRPPG
jgi:outer membrane lipoprotein-sorting protein